MIKISIPPVQNVTAAQFGAALEQYSNALQNEQQMQAAQENELNEVKNRYAPKLAILEHSRQSAYDTVETYCREQKTMLFAHRRSIGTPYGIIGFRLGTPRLRIRKGYTAKMVQEQLARQLPEYVRTKFEPAKAMLLAHRHTEKVAAKLHDVGLEVVQDELFYIHNAAPQALQKRA